MTVSTTLALAGIHHPIQETSMTSDVLPRRRLLASASMAGLAMLLHPAAFAQAVTR